MTTQQNTFKHKLGKLPVIQDDRNIKLSSILLPKAELPTVPTKFSVFDNPKSPKPSLWGNNTHGDCVEVATATHQLHYEITAQGIVIPITTANVLSFYHAIAGPGDNGTAYLDAMNYWRQKGMKVGSCRGSSTYKIDAFATIDWKNPEEVKTAIYLLDGIQVGVQLPQSAEDQWDAGKPWTIVDGSPIIGGHGLFFGGFDDTTGMYKCVTWGTLQLVEYDWFLKYPDESYAVVDNKNSKKSTINVPLLESYLQQVTQSTSHRVLINR